jgi:putative ABC transport system substrate-binding protein
MKTLRSAVIFACLWLAGLMYPLSAASGSARVDVVVSAHNAVYDEAVAGLRERFSASSSPTRLVFRYLEELESSGTSMSGIVEQDAPEAIIAIGTPAARAVRDLPASIPSVFGLVLDPTPYRERVASAVVTSRIPVSVQFEWLRRFLPEARKIGALYHPDHTQDEVDRARAEARRQGLELITRKVRSPREIPDALKSIAPEIDVLWALNDPVVISPATARSLLVFSYRNRIPFVGLSTQWVKAGALYSLDRDYREMGAQCGELAVEMIQGGGSGKGAVRTPRSLVYSINSAAASHMRIDLDSELLEGAIHVHD